MVGLLNEKKPEERLEEKLDESEEWKVNHAQFVYSSNDNEQKAKEEYIMLTYRGGC